MSVIKIDHLTKDYGNNRGVFDISFEVEKGNGPHWSHPYLYDGNMYLRHGNVLWVYRIK